MNSPHVHTKFSSALNELRKLANSAWASTQPIGHIQVLYEAIEAMESVTDEEIAK